MQRHNWLIEQGKILKDAGVELFVVGVGLSGTQKNAASAPWTAQPMNVALRHVLRRVAQQANVATSAEELYNIGTGYGGAVEDNTISIVPDVVSGRPIEHAFFATSADDLSKAVSRIFRSITSAKYSFTAPTVATVRTTDKNYLYTAYFEPGSAPFTLWPGHIYCRNLFDNGAINPVVNWDAAAPDNVSLSIPVSSSASSRRIFVGLPDNTLSPPWKRGYLNTGSSSWGDPGVTAADLGVASGEDNVIAWVRGAYFDNNAKLGDIYHSKPILVSNPSKIYFDEGFPAFAAAKEFRPRVLYAGANDGMLHAFLAGTYNSSTKVWSNGTGEELFGFVPNSLLNSVQKMIVTDDSDHSYFVDSSPRVADVWWDAGTPNNIKESSEWRTVLIGGMRKGGEGYYALDVTDPPTGGDYSNFPKVLWEYSDTSLMAESWSEPFIGKVRILDGGGTARDRFVAIFGAGPNVGGGSIGKAVIVLDVQNGQVLRTFTGMDNGVAASPTVILDSSGYIRFAYVVDINGNLWKFDFRSVGNATSSVQDTVWTATKLFTPAAGGQPAYHRADVAYTTTDGSSRYIFYGTGDQEKPVTNTGSGKFYAIKDTDSTTTTVAESSTTLLDVTPTIANSAAGGTVSTSQAGWVVKLGSVTQSYDNNIHTGEKVLADPVVFYGRVYFTTYTTNTSSPCSGGGIARVYGLNYQTGAAGMIADPAIAGETDGSRTRVPYHVYAEGGLASSPSLSINPSGQSSIFIGFSSSQTPIEIKIESPSQMKILKSWKELF